MQLAAKTQPTGALGLRLIRGVERTPTLWPGPSLRSVVHHGLPQRGLSDEVNAWRTRNMVNLWRGVRRAGVAHKLGFPTHYGALWLTLLRGNGESVDFGLASLRVLTDTGVGFIVDAFQNLVEMENMKFHGFGTGAAAEAVGNTALGTEMTTQYAVDSTRPTGTTTETSANIYRTVATFSPDSGGTIAITEHGVFSQAATGGGVLFDRSVFSAINVVAASDSIQATYDCTFTSGG